MLEAAASVGWKVKDAIVKFHGIGRLVGCLIAVVGVFFMGEWEVVDPKIACSFCDRRGRFGPLGDSGASYNCQASAINLRSVLQLFVVGRPSRLGAAWEKYGLPLHPGIDQSFSTR